jgi:hypothetical protein
MSPEELEILVLETDSVERLPDAFALLTATERKALSTAASKLRSQLMKRVPNADASERLKKYLQKHTDYQWNSEVYKNALIAVFALCPISALKRNDLFFSLEVEQALKKVIMDRKPEWLDDWIAYDLELESPRLRFEILRHWIKNGVCHKPEVEGYYRIFAWNLRAIPTRNQPTKSPISQQLINEPDMLVDIWRLFEIETSAFNTESWLLARAPEGYETWPDALVKLSESGHLDRKRLLECSLKGLHLDIKQNQLSGFHKFHERLNPTKEERIEFQSEYLLLLSHPVGHVVKFALNMLSRLEKDKALDNQKFLMEVQPVFLNETKSNSLTALKIIKRLIKKDPKLLNLAIRAAIEALRHPSVDVQSLVMEILDENNEELDDSLKSELLDVSGYVAKSLKSGLARIAHNQTQTDSSVVGSDLLFDYHTISTNILDHSILSTLEPIPPIANVDELISAVSHAVEVVDSPDDVERILDGISRLCGEKPNDFKNKVAPLLHRLTQSGGLETSNGIANKYGGFKLSLADLLLTWLTNNRYHSPENKHFFAADILKPIIVHVRNIINRVAHNKSQPLISAPTHTGGWIDPTIWVDRLIDAESKSISFEKMDLCFSLLRLAPDNRAQALKRVNLLSKDIRRIADFALGGDEKPNYSDRKNYDLWISAARSRDPYCDWSEVFEPLKLKDVWPDSVRPATYDWEATYNERKQNYGFGDNKTVEVIKTPVLNIQVKVSVLNEAIPTVDGVFSKFKSKLGLEFATDWKAIPTAAFIHNPQRQVTWFGDINTIWICNWLTYQWPLNPHSCYLTGALQQIDRLDMNGSSWSPTFGFFYGLFQKNRPWCEASHLLLSLGFIAKDADTKGLSVDAIITGIESRNLDIKMFSNALTKISSAGWIKVNRLADNLLQVAQVSSLHAYVICEIIQAWLISSDINQHNLYRILEVLLEARSQTKQPLKIELSEILSQLNGSGKAARLAKQILEG